MIRSNNAIKFAQAYGLRQTAKPLRDLAAACRWRCAEGILWPTKQ